MGWDAGNQGAMVGERGNLANLDFEGFFSMWGSRTASLGYSVGYCGLALGNNRLFVSSILFWSMRNFSIGIIAFFIGTSCFIV